MILAISGKCVIAMNKNYWNEYQAQFIDKDIEKKVLKMFQYSLPKEKPKIEKYNGIINFSAMLTPDIVIKRIDLDSVKSKEICEIFINLSRYIDEKELILCFPLICLNGRVDTLETGVYMFDLKREQLVLIKKESKFINNEDSKIILVWLLDLEKSLIVYGRSSFFLGIKHTMEVREETTKGMFKKTISLYKNQQGVVKNLGINPKLTYLIEVDSLIGGE